ACSNPLGHRTRWTRWGPRCGAWPSTPCWVAARRSQARWASRAIRSIEPGGTDRNGAVLERRGEILGYDEAGEGPVLVLVHGFPFDRRLWAGQLRGLANIRRVVAPDLRGRGLSAAIGAEGATMDTYADDVAATIASLGVEQADVGGLSMGGYVTFALWRRHPKLVRSLMLAD